jgi:hypothetical protein
MLGYCILEMSVSLRHNCAAGMDCALKQVVENLATAASEIQGRVRGLCFGLPSKGPIF